MSTLSERLQYCKVCKNKSFDPKTGVNCSLTNAKPDFEDNCEKFVIDEGEAQKLLMRKKMEAEGDDLSDSGFFAMEKKGMKKGIAGGIVMIVLALVWFFGGLAMDRIFFYPPVLLILGIVAVIRGASEGNIRGEKYKKAA